MLRCIYLYNKTPFDWEILNRIELKWLMFCITTEFALINSSL